MADPFPGADPVTPAGQGGISGEGVQLPLHVLASADRILGATVWAMRSVRHATLARRGGLLFS
ncbi:MAG TPA: hypothetical protein VGX50_14390 [Longimicrobium sp.]|nr:hypothetical protein [Longimicrobium sp.]